MNVNESAPPIGSIVLAWHPVLKDWHRMEWTGERFRAAREPEWFFCPTGDVVHWMPIPGAP